MSRQAGVFGPDQLSVIQDLFDRAWAAAAATTPSAALIDDWETLRNVLAQKVFEYANTSLTDDEIIRAVLTSMGLL
jgi:hypothetical protein